MITIDLKPLARAEPGTSVPLATTVRHPKLPDLPTLQDLAVAGSVAKVGERQGYAVTGTIDASIGMECARCLKSFDYPLSMAFSEQFHPTPTDDQFPAKKHSLELDAMLRTVILTQLPDKPLHDPDCQGLCPVCGKDRNREPHEHPEPESGPGPFDQLKKLR